MRPTITKKEIVVPETQTLPVITLQYAVRDDYQEATSGGFGEAGYRDCLFRQHETQKDKSEIAALATVP